MTFKNIRYFLAEGVDPNIFVGNDTWTVPVQDYDPVSIAVNERDKLTQLRFTGNPIKKIKDNFLGGCTSLRALEITSLYETTEIGSNFLSSCSRLNYLNLSTWTKVITIKSSFLDQCVSLDQLMLFNIDPKNITVDQDMFMNNVPNNCVLCAKDFVDQYQKTSPWSQRKDYIIE